jgi:hypothetical protein
VLDVFSREGGLRPSTKLLLALRKHLSQVHGPLVWAQDGATGGTAQIHELACSAVEEGFLAPGFAALHVIPSHPNTRNIITNTSPQHKQHPVCCGNEKCACTVRTCIRKLFSCRGGDRNAQIYRARPALLEARSNSRSTHRSVRNESHDNLIRTHCVWPSK